MPLINGAVTNEENWGCFESLMLRGSPPGKVSSFELPACRSSVREEIVSSTTSKWGLSKGPPLSLTQFILDLLTSFKNRFCSGLQKNHKKQQQQKKHKLFQSSRCQILKHDKCNNKYTHTKKENIQCDEAAWSHLRGRTIGRPVMSLGTWDLTAHCSRTPDAEAERTVAQIDN